MDQSLVSSKTLNVGDRSTPTNFNAKSGTQSPVDNNNDMGKKVQSRLSRHRSNSKLTPVQEKVNSPDILTTKVTKKHQQE